MYMTTPLLSNPQLFPFTYKKKSPHILEPSGKSLKHTCDLSGRQLQCFLNILLEGDAVASRGSFEEAVTDPEGIMGTEH